MYLKGVAAAFASCGWPVGNLSEWGQTKEERGREKKGVGAE